MDPVTFGAGINLPQPRIITSDNGHRSEDMVLMNGQQVPIARAQLIMLADIRDRLVEIRDAVQSLKEG
jgi:hypothetical protein